MSGHGRSSFRLPFQKGWLPLLLLVLLVGVFLFRDQHSDDESGSTGNSVTGKPHVIDGDTLEIGGTRVRLFGIDAPEGGQSCSLAGKDWACGYQATAALRARIGSRVVRCNERDVDQYERMVAVCQIDGEDLNSWLVAAGWAVAYRKYSTAYVADEKRAASSHRGIWKGDFVNPSDWRRGER